MAAKKKALSPEESHYIEELIRLYNAPDISRLPWEGEHDTHFIEELVRLYHAQDFGELRAWFAARGQKTEALDDSDFRRIKSLLVCIIETLFAASEDNPHGRIEAMRKAAGALEAQVSTVERRLAAFRVVDKHVFLYQNADLGNWAPPAEPLPPDPKDPQRYWKCFEYLNTTEERRTACVRWCINALAAIDVHFEKLDPDVVADELKTKLMRRDEGKLNRTAVVGRHETAGPILARLAYRCGALTDDETRTVNQLQETIKKEVQRHRDAQSRRLKRQIR